MPADIAPRTSLRRSAAAVVLVATLVVTACGAPPSSGGGGGRAETGEKVKLPPCPVGAYKKASGKVKVDLWYGGLGGVTAATLEDMAKRFNARQDKIVVEPNSQGDSYEKTLRKYEGTAPTPDLLPQIIYLEDTALGEIVDKGQVLPAESCMKADDYDSTQISAVARSAFSVDGVLYPGYMNVSTPVLYYNKIHFQQAGLDPEDPPDTLEELREAAEVLKRKGLSEHPLSFKNDRWFFESWLSGIGQDVVNHDNGRTETATKATFNTPEAVKLMEFFKDMNDDGLIIPFAKTEGSLNHYLALLPVGDKKPKASMLVESSTATANIEAFLGGKLTAEQAGEDFDVANVDIDTTKIVPGAGPLPGIEAPGKIFASGGAFYILQEGSSAAEQSAAWEFLKFMLEPENSYKWHTDGGYLPIVKKALDIPGIRDFWKDDLSGVMLKPAVEQLTAADPDQNGPLIAPYQKYGKAIDDMENNVMLDGADPADELDKAEKAVDAILKDDNGG